MPVATISLRRSKIEARNGYSMACRVVPKEQAHMDPTIYHFLELHLEGCPILD